jgi:hypothetical protein
MLFQYGPQGAAAGSATAAGAGVPDDFPECAETMFLNRLNDLRFTDFETVTNDAIRARLARNRSDRSGDHFRKQRRAAEGRQDIETQFQPNRILMMSVPLVNFFRNILRHCPTAFPQPRNPS